MAEEMTSVFEAYFRRNRGPNPDDPGQPQVPECGLSANLDGAVINLQLIFRRGRVYCCSEAGCHLGLPTNHRWEWLRREIRDCGIVPPSRMELRL